MLFLHLANGCAVILRLLCGGGGEGGGGIYGLIVILLLLFVCLLFPWCRTAQRLQGFSYCSRVLEVLMDVLWLPCDIM